MPPDEWHYPVNNSAYTNTVAKISLLLPKYAYSLIGETAPAEYEEIADLMYVPFDSQKQYHPEFDGFTWSKSSILCKVLCEAQILNKFINYETLKSFAFVGQLMFYPEI